MPGAESDQTTDDPAILAVDDEPGGVDLLSITLGMDYTVYTATDGDSALRILEQHPEIALAIIDQRMPGMSGTEFIRHTVDPYPKLVRVILTGYTDFDALIEAINAGSVYRYLSKPYKKNELLSVVRQGLERHQLMQENMHLLAQLKEANDRLAAENVELKREVRGRYRFDGLIGASPKWLRTLGILEKAVASDATVLITGESGTGKELIAKALHYNGARAQKPFVVVNCADFVGDTLTSELFGHRRGAFTGAVEDREGMFRAANGGTIFLDEIGECPPPVQARLLRVLQEREIRRLGDDRPSKVDVRVVAATNRDLQAESKAGTFRQDLYYRLNVVNIALPPLRERHDDIVPLAKHFLEKLSEQTGKKVRGFTPEALAALCGHPFEGNVRELENLVYRALTLADAGALLTPDLFPDAMLGGANVEVPDLNGGLSEVVARFEAQLIRAALERNGGNQTKTAVDLQLSRRTLVDKLQKYGLTNAQRSGEADDEG